MPGHVYGLRAVQRSICMGQATRGCCAGSRPAPALQHDQLLHSCSGRATWPPLVLPGLQHIDGPVPALCNIADEATGEIYARLLHTEPFGGAPVPKRWQQLHGLFWRIRTNRFT